MEKKNIGLVALLAGIAATSTTVQADEVKPKNPFVAEERMQVGQKTVVARGVLPCTRSELAYMRLHGWTPMCN